MPWDHWGCRGTIAGIPPKGAERENHRLKSALFGVGYVSFREGKALKGFSFGIFASIFCWKSEILLLFWGKMGKKM